ncbi:13551_t:CDS:2 [Dentiscutata heterogama]|uniref:13551_t:CDS:1 n=1 Tax=Dentiscutata heterogama TaxID=1316150 RepID=A0ACA9MHW1_9GLOM|nr:13551_t:CDS:2 [Dentiscutata heterogama]
MSTQETPTTPIKDLEDITLTDLKDNSTFKASTLWQDSPALVLLCREEAIKVASYRDLISDKLGVKMVAIVHENLDNEIEEFNKGYWNGLLYFDKEKSFFSHIGGGQIQYGGIMSFLKPSVWFNIRQSMKTGVTGNFKGDGYVLGGLYIIRQGSGGVEYQYREKVWGDHAPFDQVLTAVKNVSAKKDEPDVKAAFQETLDKVKKGEIVFDSVLKDNSGASCTVKGPCA